MSTMDDFRNNYSRKLDEAKDEHDKRVEVEMQQFNSDAPTEEKLGVPNKPDVILKETDFGKLITGSPSLPKSLQSLVNVTESDSLRSLDNNFIKLFDLTAFYPVDKINYRTILCDTLDEFCGAIIDNEKLSDQEREKEILKSVKDYKEKWQKGSYVMGVNLPGYGCFVNGWQIGELNHISPQKIRPENERIYKEVLKIAAHEKLGHGFITAFSVLGELNAKMGFTRIQIAKQFGVSTSDDPVSTLLDLQWSVIFGASKFLEEGWATWIEGYLQKLYFPPEREDAPSPFRHPKYSQENLVGVLNTLPNEIKNNCLTAWYTILQKEDASIADLLIAVNIMSSLDREYDGLFSGLLGQPLRYVLGELICSQCEKNLGIKCIPYAILIAANITLDSGKISFTDLNVLLHSDPRLNPDARLAAISKIKLNHPGDIQELIQKVNSDLSLSIPPELRK